MRPKSPGAHCRPGSDVMISSVKTMGSCRGRRAGSALAAVVVAGLMLTDVSSAAAGVVPRAACQPGDKPDTALQGQVPLADRATGRAAEGYICNLRVAGTHPGRVFSA